MSKHPPGFLTPEAHSINVDPSYFLDNQEEHYKASQEFYQSIGSPKYVCAPMVHQSELPFRVFVRKYGCDLAYTPMLNATALQRNPRKVKNYFDTCEGDSPTFAQLAGDNPDLMLRAALLVQDNVAAVDINFGCPQQIAKRGHYGSFLLEETQLIQKLVRTLKDGLKVPVTVKMRILVNDPTGEKTLALGRAQQDSGASLVTLHGRTREMLKLRLAECDFSMIKRMKDTLSVPLLSNGGISSMEDVQRTMEITGANGVMVSEALLCWPTMFAYKTHEEEPSTIDVAIELLDCHNKFPGWHYGVRPHVFKVLFQELNTHTEFREALSAPKLGSDLKPILRFLRKKQLKLYQKYAADPAAFDFEYERWNADGSERYKEIQAALREDCEPTWKPAEDDEVFKLLGKKYAKGEVLQMTDDGVDVVLPAEAKLFLREFYSHTKPWYFRYFGRLESDKEVVEEDSDAEPVCKKAKIAQ